MRERAHRFYEREGFVERNGRSCSKNRSGLIERWDPTTTNPSQISTRSPASMRAMKILTALAILSIAGQANAQLIDASLAPAPVAAAADTTADTMAMNSLAEAQAGASITVDPANRAAVAALYFSTYLPEDNATNGWTGSITGCNAGHTATAFQAATLERINVYRAMAGLPGNVVLFPGTANQSADQQAALMMVANNALNHTPPTTWKCYTAAGGGRAERCHGSLQPDARHRFQLQRPHRHRRLHGRRRWRQRRRRTPPLAVVSAAGADGDRRHRRHQRQLGPLVQRAVGHRRIQQLAAADAARHRLAAARLHSVHDDAERIEPLVAVDPERQFRQRQREHDAQWRRARRAEDRCLRIQRPAQRFVHGRQHHRVGTGRRHLHQAGAGRGLSRHRHAASPARRPASATT